jgi:outer membrane protein assembly factor BamB
VYAWDAETGKQAWVVTQPPGLVGSSSPTATGGRVYVGMGDGLVRAIGASSGETLWTRTASSVFGPGSAPAVAGGSVYALAAEGRLLRVRASDGAKVWDFLFDTGSGRSSPLVTSQFVYVGLDDGTVAAVSVASGNLVWQSHPERGPVGPLAPAGAIVLAPDAGRGGALVAYGHTTGALTDVVSPSRLNLAIALLNFAIAAVIVAFGAAGFAALEARVRARRSEGAA